METPENWMGEAHRPEGWNAFRKRYRGSRTSIQDVSKAYQEYKTSFEGAPLKARVGAKVRAKRPRKTSPPKRVTPPKVPSRVSPPRRSPISAISSISAMDISPKVSPRDVSPQRSPESPESPFAEIPLEVSTYEESYEKIKSRDLLAFFEREFDDRLCVVKKRRLLWKHDGRDFDLDRKSSLGMIPRIRTCMASPLRFVAIHLHLDYKKASHANVIIIDKETLEVERFEPHGKTSNKYEPVILDVTLEAYFNRILPGVQFKYYSSLEFCPKIGFQSIQETRTRREYEGVGLEGKMTGFCRLWSYFYLYVRLLNPNKSRQRVVELALENIETENMTNFIRRFTEYMYRRVHE